MGIAKTVINYKARNSNLKNFDLYCPSAKFKSGSVGGNELVIWGCIKRHIGKG